jgi:2Fe-2S ferredoxin
MEVAMDNMVPHILADCGGCISCGTCRVDVVETWQSVVGQATASEADLIEGLDQPTPASRLACQVTVTEEMQGAEFLLSDEFC